MAKDSVSKKSRGLDTGQTLPDPGMSDADALLVASPPAGLSGPTEQFSMRAAENTEQFTLPPSANTEQFTLPSFGSTEQFTMKPADDDEPEALVQDQTVGEMEMGDGSPATMTPARNLDTTQAMGSDEDETVRRKSGATMGPGAKAGGASGDKDGPKATLLGDYKLIKKLGQGGMGSVYKAQHVKLDREVALKILSKELSSKEAFVKRFQREAKVMAKLDHPNILRCFDVGEHQGFHYLSMEFVEGGSIEGYLKKFQKFSIGDALHIVIACAAALDHAHELGLIHRDIKPDNILLTKKGVVKVADLGLAKATDDDMSLTKTGTGAGTPIYMAPEQARDAKHVDGRCDIYALGCMLYVFLTGEAPFKGETLVELIEAKEKAKFSPMRKFNSEVPERLDLVVDKMLAKEPKHRYASCAEIIAELEGLGLANASLSFVAEASQVKTVPNKPLLPAAPAKVTQKPQARSGSTMAPASVPAPAAAAPAEPKLPDDYYYWQFTNDEGKQVTKKLKKEQLVTLVKSGSIDATDQVSRSQKGGYRALGTYVEFSTLFRGAATRKEADKTRQKFKQAYKELAQQEVSRQRWRWLHNLYLRAGGLFGFLLWMVVVIGVLIGGYFLVRFLLGFIGDKVAKSGQL